MLKKIIVFLLGYVSFLFLWDAALTWRFKIPYVSYLTIGHDIAIATILAIAAIAIHFKHKHKLKNRYRPYKW